RGYTPSHGCASPAAPLSGSCPEMSSCCPPSSLAPWPARPCGHRAVRPSRRRASSAAGDELRLGAGIPQTRILCASYHQDPAVTLPLLTLLPDMLHIPPRRAAHPPGHDWTTT